jgi:Plasmid pRiA4b ORF-3-like protein
MSNILQLKITLKDSKPSIWRRVLVPADINFFELHNIIQTAMGWDNAHLWEFEADGMNLGPVDEDGMFGFEPGEMDDASKEIVGKLIGREKAKCRYTYDMGDDWRHEVLVEKIMPAEKGRKYPVCIDGKNSCPPEDCGGIWGYYELLETIKNPKHPEHGEMLDWLGGDFDPEEFDLEEVNRML